jgi:hypothetical protein
MAIGKIARMDLNKEAEKQRKCLVTNAKHEMYMNLLVVFTPCLHSFHFATPCSGISKWSWLIIESACLIREEFTNPKVYQFEPASG